MSKSRIFAVACAAAALVASSFLLGRASAGEEEPAPPAPTRTVERYRIFLVDSVLEWSHGMGRWAEELHLAGEGEGFDVNVTYDSDPPRPKATAFDGAARNRFQVHPGEEETVTKIEKVEIPEALAKEIDAFADLSRRQREASYRLGKKLVDEGVVRPVNGPEEPSGGK